MRYSVVYDIATEPLFTPSFLWAGLLFVALSFIYLAGTRKVILNSRKENTNKLKKSHALLCLFFSVVFLISSIASDVARRNTLLSSSPEIVEGVVSKFVHGGLSGHSPERFCVENKCFSYSASLHTGGFNTPSVFGGAIHEGVEARIFYIENTIIKIELKK